MRCNRLKSPVIERSHYEELIAVVSCNRDTSGPGPVPLAKLRERELFSIVSEEIPRKKKLILNWFSKENIT